MNKLFSLSCSLFILMLIGCKDDVINTTSQPPNAIDPTYDGLIPLAIGNCWVFVDSLQMETDTAKIVDYENNSDLIWWKLNKQIIAMKDFSNNFAIRNDTVFIKEPLRGGGEIIAFVIIPPRDSSFSYNYLVGGDASSRREVTYYHNGFTVPAGTFQNYACYVEDIGLGKDSLVIVPKVGVVCRVTEWISFPGAKYNRETHYLKEFHLKSN